MREASIPLQESARLAELRAMRLLDTLPEERFDRITRIGQRLFQVPMALISLVDSERQFFKSRQGCELSETSRQVSFCAHAILQDQVFMVPDALEDERFHDNPLVTGEPHIRFYCGYPLAGPGGYRIGSFCLIDRVPRTLDEGQLQAFRELGRWVQLELSVNAMDETANRLAREQEMIDEMHNLNVQLAMTTRLQQAILNGTNYSIISTDLEGNIVLFNAGAEQMLGYQADEMLGRTPVAIHVADEVVARAAQLSAELDRVIEPGFEVFVARVRGGEPDAREWTYVRKDGTRLPVMLSVTGLFDSHHNLTGFLGVAYDLTEQKRVEQMKSEFISTVSHELRTPLTSIRGALGLLVSGVVGEVTPRAHQMLDIAKNNCERLVRLINDILDIEKIESGNMRFDMASHPLQGLIGQAIGLTQTYATQYQVSLRAESPDEMIRVEVDADRLLQVLVNLLSNACKFSPQGSEVLVKVTLAGNWVRVAVIDHGPGIPESFRSRIFQKFAQNDSSDARVKGGTGLGLNISRAIMERMAGRISFTSEVNQGSTFFIELPCKVECMVAASEQASILVCEDDYDISRLLVLMLGQAGWVCDVAHDAVAARALLQKNSYRAMTLDLALPDEDGLSLLRWIRSRPETLGLPVVVVSAKADVGHHSLQGGAVGVMDWLPKPIDEERLLSVLRRVDSLPRTRMPVVLHVDDDLDLARVVSALLQSAYQVVHAATLEQARARLEQQQFDLILLDLNLPDGSGAQLLGSLPVLNLATPTVIFSAQEVDQGLLERVRGALIKSKTSNEQLLSTLTNVIERCYP